MSSTYTCTVFCRELKGSLFILTWHITWVWNLFVQLCIFLFRRNANEEYSSCFALFFGGGDALSLACLFLEPFTGRMSSTELFIIGMYASAFSHMVSTVSEREVI